MSIKLYDKSGGTPQEVLLAGTPTTDLILNGTSKNPIANKTVYNALATKIESTVENLVNFYNKSQVYNKQEVRDLIGAINTLTIEVVNELPTQDISATTIYFLKQSGANTYDEYIYVDNAWVKIGDTDIDLSGYLTTANFQVAIADYYTKSAIDAMIANYYTKTQVDAMVDAKQDELTFDNAPTADSDNPVKSGGIKTALDAKQNTLTFDSTPTTNSNNPVTSDGIKAAIDDKADQSDLINESQARSWLGAKNLIPFDLDVMKKRNTDGTWTDNVYSINGIDFTVNSDGTVSASGTASGTASLHFYDCTGSEVFIGQQLKLSGCPQGGSQSGTYKLMAYRAQTADGSAGTVENYGDSTSPFTWLNDCSGTRAYVSMTVYPGAGTVSNLIFKPMLRLADDIDDTYQSYAMTNKQLTDSSLNIWDAHKLSGAKNLLVYPTIRQTSSGVEYIVNEDLSITVNRIATSSSNSYFNSGSYAARYNYSFVIQPGTYIFSGGSGSKPSTISAVYLAYKSSGTRIVSWTTKPVTFSITEPTEAMLVMWCTSTLSPSNVTIYPMLRVAGDEDNTYVPFAYTNSDITNRLLSGNLFSYMKMVQTDLNTYMTSDVVPEDFSALTTQEATDIVQAAYDMHYKVGGYSGVSYIGTVSRRWLKGSDNSQLGSSSGFYVLYAGQTYQNALNNNSSARLTIAIFTYGSGLLEIIGIWGKQLRYSRVGLVDATDNTKVAEQCAVTYSTISTYRG